MAMIPFSSTNNASLYEKLKMAIMPFFSSNNDGVHEKLEELRDIMQQLKSKADDIQDEVRNEVLQSRKKTKSEVSLWLQQVSIFEVEVGIIGTKVAQVGIFGRRRQLSNELDGIMEHGAQLLKQGEFPRGVLLDDFKPQGHELVIEKLEGSTPSKIEDKVWRCFDERGERMVGIFGIGGVGKTSLAMHINNQILNRLTHLFDCVYFVTVSGETTVLKLQSDIAKVLKVQLEYEDELNRAGELMMALAKRKKSLLILDDVWEDIPMEKVGVSMEDDGCKLLITTRKRDVCNKMNCFPVKMNTLSPNESWYLFKKQLRNFEALPGEVKGIASSVAKECDGLPLGIVTMARSMRGETSVHVWRNALKRLKNPCSSTHDMESKVFRILRFSYDRLNEEKHRKCFLYCALYPEDYKIEKMGLIRQFIAAGLLDGTYGTESIDEGYALLNDLENASLLECGASIWGGWKWVKMHDLVRDMAIRIIGSTGMVIEGKGYKEILGKKEWISKDLQWVSLLCNDIEVEGVLSDCPNISVLFLLNNFLKIVSGSLFMQMIGLQVLNMKCANVEELPDSVSDMCNLTALLLSGCTRLCYIPSLAKLKKLRELNLQGCHKVDRLPEGMEELSSLEHLNLRGTEIQGMQRGIFMKLLNLKSIVSNCKIIIPPDELMSLRNLEKLTGVLFDDVSWFNQCFGIGLFNQFKIYHVTVAGKDFHNRGRYISGRQHDRLIEFHQCNIGGRSLVDALPWLGDATALECCKFTKCKGIPEWWEKHLQVGIPHVTSCLGLVELRIEKCPELKKLWILNLELPNLEEIYIDNCEQMEEIFAADKRVTLPKLRSLRLHSLPKLRSIWTLIPDLPNLEMIDISLCKRMEEIFSTEKRGTIRLPKLRSLNLLFLPELRSIWALIPDLPNLEMIQISFCEQMEEIFSTEKRGTIRLPKLRSLNLRSLPELRSIWTLIPDLPNLEMIDISFCKQMEEIFSTEKRGTIRLPKLRSLKLDSLPELRSIWGNCEVFLPHLVSLSIWQVPKIKQIGEVRNMLSLEKN